MSYLTSHVITATDLVDVDATPWAGAGTRVLTNSIDKLLLVGTVLKGSCLKLRARLALVE